MDWFPDVPDISVSHMEVQGTNVVSLESLSLAGTQIQSLTVANNKLRRISEKAFRYIHLTCMFFQ